MLFSYKILYCTILLYFTAAYVEALNGMWISLQGATAIQATINWGAAQGGVVANYSLFITQNGGEAIRVHTSSSAGSYVVMDLTPSTQYTALIIAYAGIAGEQDSSASTQFSTDPYQNPSTPSLQSTTPSHSMLRFTWNTANGGTYGVGYYVLSVRNTNNAQDVLRVVYNGTGLTYDATGLVGGVTYSAVLDVYDTRNNKAVSTTANAGTRAPDPPGQPQSFSPAANSPDTITVTWRLSGTTGSYAMHNNTLYMWVGQSNVPTANDIIFSTTNLSIVSYQVTGLQPSSSYKFRLITYDVAGYGSNPADGTGNTPNVNIPGAPNNVQYTASAPNTITTSWSAANKGSYDIAGYILRFNPRSTNNAFIGYNGTVLSHVQTGLTAGAYDVYASTYDVKGYTSTETSGFVNVVSPSPPSQVNPSTRDLSVSGARITWTTSTPGANPIANYTLYAKLTSQDWSSGVVVYSGTNLSFNITTFSAATGYDLRLICYDTLGYGSVPGVASFTTLSVTPASTPSIDWGTHGINEVTITWSKGNPGSYPIAGYLLYQSDDHLETPFELIYNGTITNHTQTGLIGGRSYSYRVYIFDNKGYRNNPANVQAVPRSATPPGQPTITISSVDSYGANITWAESTGGTYAVKNYTLYLRNHIVYSGLETKYSFSGLVPSSTYDVRVVSYDVQGFSSMSEVSFTTSLGQPPTTPTMWYNSTVDNTTISWTASQPGSYDFAYYFLEYSHNAGAYSVAYNGTDRSYTAIGLSTSGYYTFRISAYDVSGNVSPTRQITVYQAAVVPPSGSTVTSVSITAISANLTWTDATPNTYPIQEYRFYFGSLGSETLRYTGTNKYFIIENLTPATSYSAYVVVYDNRGTTSVINTKYQFNTHNAVYPEAPVVAVDKNEPFNVTISWTSVASGTYPIVKYEVSKQYQGVGASDIVFSALGFSLVLTNLSMGTDIFYNFKVYAVDSQGNVGQFQIISVYPAPVVPPSRPTINIPVYDEISAQVAWNVSTKGTYDIMNYTLYFNLFANSGWNTVYSGLSTTYLLTDLEPGTNYKVRVIAYDVRGYASEAADAQFQTNQLRGPSAPDFTYVTDPDSTTLSWTTPTPGTYPFGYYVLTGRHNSDADILYYNGTDHTLLLTTLSTSGYYYFTLTPTDVRGNSGAFATLYVQQAAVVVASRPQLSLTTTPITASLTWEASTNGSYAISNYTMYFALASSSTWNTVYSGLNLSFVVTDLEPNTNYKVEIICYDVRGYASEASYNTLQTLPVVLPSVPAQFNYTSNPDNTTLSWGTATAGTYPFSHFILAASYMGTNNSIVYYNGTDTRVTYSELSRVGYYYFTLHGVDTKGNAGYPLTLYVVQALVIPPSRPQASYTATSTYANITWAASQPGSFAIANYTLLFSLADGSNWARVYAGANLGFVVENLEPNTNYRFQVVCYDERGNPSEAGENTLQTLPVVLPGTPASFNYTSNPGDNSTLYWTIGSIGTFAFKNFVVTAKYNNAGDEIVYYSGQSTTLTITTLNITGYYYFNLYVVDVKNNTGVPQVLVVHQAPIEPPGRPQASYSTTPVLTNITWTPSQPGSFPIARYDVLFGLVSDTNLPVVYSGLRHNFVVVDLEPNTNYQFKVIAYDVRGTPSVPAENNVHTQLVVIPGVISQFNYTSNADNTTLTWGTSERGTYPIHSYVLVVSRNNVEPYQVYYNGTGAQSLTITDFNSTGYYYFIIYAVDTRGNAGFPQHLYVEQAPVVPPGRPQITWNTTPLILNITWAPSQVNSYALSHYVLSISLANPTNWTPVYTGPNTAFVVENLQPNTQYQVRVIGYDVRGYASEAGYNTFQTQLAVPPSIPSTLTYTSNPEDNTTLTWSAVTGNTYAFSHYILEASYNGSSGPWVLYYNGSSTSVTISTLSTNGYYYFRVKAVDVAGGESYPQNALVQQASAVPPSRPQVSYISTSTSISFTWVPSVKNSFEISHYILYFTLYEAQNWQVVYTGTGLSHVLSDLTTGTAYSFRVVCYDVRGFASLPGENNANTLQLELPTIPTLEADATHPDYTTLTWTTSNKGTYDIAGYVLTYYEQNGDIPVVVYNGTGLTFTTTSLSSDSWYYFQVLAYDVRGNRGAPASLPVYPAKVSPPSRPSLVIVLQGTITAIASWNPSTAGSYDFSHYTLYFAELNKTYTVFYNGTDNNITFTNLLPAKQYKAQVIAVDVRQFASEPSVQTFTTNSLSVPTEVSVTYITDLNSTTIQWTEASAGTYPLAGYYVEYSEQETGVWTLAYTGFSLSWTTTSLNLSTWYYFRVAAFDIHGNTNYAQSLQVHPGKGPTAAPTPVPTGGATTPAPSTSAPTTPAATPAPTTPAPTTPAPTTSAPTPAHTSTPTPTPTAAPAPKVAAGNTTRDTIQVSWEASGVSAESYALQMTTDGTNWQTVYTGSAKTYTATSLHSNTTYYFRLEASNSSGAVVASLNTQGSTQIPVCGDGVCDSDETCKSCYLDCRHTCQSVVEAKCPGTPVCSGHGQCNSGACVCDTDYSGPRCDQVNLPVVVTTPATGSNAPPAVVIKPSTPSTTNVGSGGSGQSGASVSGGNVPTDLAFEISVIEVREVTRFGETVATYPLSLDQSSSYSSNSSDAYSEHTFVITLPNGATIKVFITFFSVQTELVFAEQQMNLSPDSIKLAIEVSRWPFVTYSNQISFIMQSYIDSSSSACVQANDDESQLQWLKIISNGVSLYGSFLQHSEVDGKIRATQFSWENKGSGLVKMTLPHFYDRAMIDPNFAVLLETGDMLENDPCAASSLAGENKGITFGVMEIGITVGAVGAAAIIAGVVGYKYRTSKSKKRIRSISRLSMMTSSKELQSSMANSRR